MGEGAGEKPQDIAPESTTPPLTSVDTSSVELPAPTGPTPLGWRGLLLALAVIWATNVIVQFAVGVVIGIFAFLNHEDPQARFMQPAVLMPLTAVGWFVAIAVGWYFACSRPAVQFSDGFAAKPVSHRLLSIAALLGFVGALIAMAITTSVGETHSTMGEMAIVKNADGTNRPSFWILALALCAPPFEELYYRGFLFTALSRLASTRVAFVVIALWFASIHAFQLAGDWFFLLWVAVMGVLWTWMRARYNSIAASMTCHWVYNGTLVVGGLVGWWISS